MDATTILAVLCSAAVFIGWLYLPHSPATAKATAVNEEREPVALSA